MTFKSGFFTIIGRPNVGKSTLLNLLAGQKIAITSNKPQTTRNMIKTVITTKDFQVVFIDTPGIHKPKNKLGDFMNSAAFNTLNEVDGIIFMVDASEEKVGAGNSYIIEQLKNTNNRVFLLINKIDQLMEKEKLLTIIDNYSNLYDFEQIIPVSALESKTKDIILAEIGKVLPEGPKFFPDDMLTDQPEKVIVQEIIREKILYLIKEEIPHGVAVEVILFKERNDLIEIHANIYCEKDSHKGIIIGNKGLMLKNIGSQARVDIENLLGSKVFLKLWVKVKNDWRNSDFMLNSLGYK